MGKVSRRLTIVVFPPLSDWPEIAKLEEQGHTILRVPVREFVTTTIAVELRSAEFINTLLDADLVIGPQCWYFDTKHRKYLTQAIKQSRLRRYGTPQRKAGKKDAEDDITDGSGDDTSSIAAAKEFE